MTAVPNDDLVARVRRQIAAKQLLPSRGRIIVAVSGGADSVALLHVLSRLQPEWKFTLHVAHLDHALRNASREDATFVRELCARRRIPVTIERREVRSVCATEGWSLEDGARRIRYAFLLAVARQQSASRIALAHTADDQAETVLMRLLRGTGLFGLRAIPLARELEGVWLVRPLLDVWRREIIAYLDQNGAAYRDDETNTDPRFVRNRIRHELLPQLERDYNPRIKQALVQLTEQCVEDYDYLQGAAARQWKRLAKARRPARVVPPPAGVAESDRRGAASAIGGPAGGEVEIAVSAFRRQPRALQRQLVRQAIQEVRGDLRQFEFRHWVETERLFGEQSAGALLDLPGGVQFLREAARVICRRVHTADQR